MKNKHNCKNWFEEAIGCAICSKIILKSPIKTIEELEKLIVKSNWIITEQKKEIDKLKKPIKLIIKTTDNITYTVFAQDHNMARDKWETWIINSLEAIKTDMNQKEIEGLIREIKGQ